MDDVNSHGANIQAGEYGDFANRKSGGTFGQIAEIACSYGTSDDNNGCDRPLSLNARIAYRIYDGVSTSNAAPTATPAPSQVTLTHDDMKDLASMQKFCDANSETVSCSFENGAAFGVKLGDADLDTGKNATIVNGSKLTITYVAQPSSTNATESTNP